MTMRMFRRNGPGRHGPWVAVVAVSILGFPALGQETDDLEGLFDLEDVMVIGSRVRGVSQDELAVPVDVYEAENLTFTGTTDLGVALQKVAPSFNSKRNYLGDGGLFHTATLRGMNPDHTLLLVNGKRRHSLSFPRPLDQVGYGTTGYDLRSLPMAAVERIEVLRDGAAAQYGSDAIGGVINVVLKEDADVSTLGVHAARTSAGDGDRIGASTNLGFAVGDGGALNLTAEVYDQGRTDRSFNTSGPHLDPIPNSTSIERQMILGEPEHDHGALFVNATLPVREWTDLYAFGGWSERNGISSGAWRDPTWALDRMVSPVHPDGFLPLEVSRTRDLAAVVGVRSTLGRWQSDFSLNYGTNAFDFGATNSINASWAAGWLQQQLDQGTLVADITPDDVAAHAGPSSGDSGGTEIESWSVDLDLTGELALGSRVIDMAFGGEFRREEFRIRPGDYASYGCGPPDYLGEYPAVGLEDGKVVQLSGLARCGHQGYPGYAPTNAEFSQKERDSQALWTNVRHDALPDLNLEAALRWEHHDGAGDSTTGMAGFRYDISPDMAVRGTVSTGFRAPSLPQRGFNAVAFLGGGEDAGLSVSAVLEEGAAFQYFNVGPAALGHETSTNVGGGIVLHPGPRTSISLDGYAIEIDGRIAFTTYEPDCAGADAAGCASLLNDRSLPRITNIQYFDNVIDTRTVGMDLVARHEADALNGALLLTGALHFNETDITDEEGPISSASRSFIVNGNPRQQHRFSAAWSRDSLDLHFGLNYYGKTQPEWLSFGADCPGEISSAWIADAEAGWRVGKVRLAFGIDNLFDQYPEEIDKESDCYGLLNSTLGWGIPYSPDTSYGLAGQVFYTRMEATF